MPATRLWTNPQAAGYTPAGGALLPIGRITNATIDANGQRLTFSGDGDRYDTLNVNIGNAPAITLTGGDFFKFLGLMNGGFGTLVITYEDAKNVLGTGSAVVTLINAAPDSPSGGAAHRQVGSGTITFVSSSADGITNPLSFTLAA